MADLGWYLVVAMNLPYKSDPSFQAHTSNQIKMASVGSRKAQRPQSEMNKGDH